MLRPALTFLLRQCTDTFHVQLLNDLLWFSATSSISNLRACYWGGGDSGNATGAVASMTVVTGDSKSTHGSHGIASTPMPCYEAAAHLVNATPETVQSTSCGGDKVSGQ